MSWLLLVEGWGADVCVASPVSDFVAGRLLEAKEWSLGVEARGLHILKDRRCDYVALLHYSSSFSG